MNDSATLTPTATVIVSGSVAAVKAPATLRRLREAGFDTRVIATRASLHFVTPLALAEAGASTPATDETWFAPQPVAQHLQLARADVVIVVAASADLIARAGAGRSDDLAAATLLATRAPVLWAPAMNESMWTHPATQAHVAQLNRWGHRFLGPTSGAFGTPGEGAGVGRMAEPEEIARAALDLRAPQDLAGLTVAVSAGPTREYLDPVRFISNPSSGKMGFAVAEVARARGAAVTLVTGPVELASPPGVEVVRVQSALEMRDAMLRAARAADVVVMTAAVADYRAANPATEKQPKSGEDAQVALTPNPDILAELGRDKGARVLVGFAMETHQGVERAADKARRKRADFILLNYPTREGTAFGGDDNQVTLVRADGTHEDWPRMSKRAVAERLLSEALAARRDQPETA